MGFHFLSATYWKGQRSLVLAFFVFHFVFTLIYVNQQPLTNDEADYIEYSKRWLKGEPLKVRDVDDSKTPLTAIAWLPRIAQQSLQPGMQLNDWGRSDQVNGRYMMFIFFWGVFLYVYLFGKNLYGRHGWIVPLLLLVIDPLFMAFTPIVTSDMLCVLVLLATIYHAYCFSINDSWKHFLMMSTCCGLALLAKSSMLFVPLILVVIFAARWFFDYSTRRVWSYYVRRVLIFAFLCWLIVNAGYYFYNSFATWGSYSFKSQNIGSIFKSLSFISSFPRLLPEPFIQGFDLLEYHKEQGPFHPDMPFKGAFILGTKYPHGVWFYYIVTGFFKLPVGFLLLLLVTTFYCIRYFLFQSFILKYQFIIVPVLVYGFALSFLNPFQQGIRHAMILFPFLFLGVGYTWQKAKSTLRWVIMASMAFSMISVATFYPDIMHYTNEFIVDKKQLFHYLAEFNYRQGDILLDTKSYRDKHPEVTLAPDHSAAGKFIVPGAYVYNSTYEVYNQYKWLQKYKPVDIYRNVYLVYDIK